MAPETKDDDSYHYRTYTDNFVNVRGKKIHCYYWEPNDKPRALVLICHGFTDHTMMYESVAKKLASHRFLVFANDHAGHGRSEGARAHVSSLHNLVEDTTFHIEKMRKKFPDMSVYIWGHSMGGAVALLTCLQNTIKINGVIALAPAIMPNPETATYVRVNLAKFFAIFIPQLPVAYADVSLSLRDAQQIEQLNKDPLRHHGYFKARTITSLLKGGEEILKKKDTFSVPYLLLHGDSDKVCDVKGSETLHNFAISKDKTFIVYPGAYHSLFQDSEEIATDVIYQSIKWLEQRS